MRPVQCGEWCLYYPMTMRPHQQHIICICMWQLYQIINVLRSEIFISTFTWSEEGGDTNNIMSVIDIIDIVWNPKYREVSTEDRIDRRDTLSITLVTSSYMWHGIFFDTTEAGKWWWSWMSMACLQEWNPAWLFTHDHKRGSLISCRLLVSTRKSVLISPSPRNGHLTKDGVGRGPGE